MKLTIALFSIILTLGFGACTSIQTPAKTVGFTPCQGTEKEVVLIGSFEPGGTVVRLVH